MKKLTLKIFAILTLFFGLLLCVSVLGCGNTASGNSANEIDGEKIIDSIFVSPFWAFCNGI